MSSELPWNARGGRDMVQVLPGRFLCFPQNPLKYLSLIKTDAHSQLIRMEQSFWHAGYKNKSCLSRGLVYLPKVIT